MSDKLQTLRVVSRLFPLIMSGAKTSTIRWRETQIVPGSMLYICEDDPSQTVVVNVFRCSDLPLHKAAEFIGKEDQWPDFIMLKGMREHYPEITLSDIVQVIEHFPPN